MDVSYVSQMGQHQYYVLKKESVEKRQVLEMMSSGLQILSMLCLEDTRAYMGNMQLNIFFSK